MKNKANFQIILLYLIVLTIIGGCMPSPKIEYNIEDQYTVTQNNAVGAEDRGNVAVTGVSELVITTIPQTLGGNSCKTLQEIIDYADGNSNDVVTIDLDHTFEEMNINIPDTNLATIQAEDGHDVQIKIPFAMVLRYNYADVQTSINSGATVAKTPPSGKSTVAGSGNTVYFPGNKDDTTGTTTRSVAAGQSYVALCPNTNRPERALITNGVANSADYIQGNTTVLAGLTNVNISDSQIRYSGSTVGTAYERLFMTSTTNTQLHYVDASGGSYAQTTIIVKDADNQSFPIDGWDINEGWGNSSASTTIVGGVAAGFKNGSRVSYVYDGYDFTQPQIVRTFNSKIIAVSRTQTDPTFLGGEEIWEVTGSNFVRKASLDFTPTHALFSFTYSESYEFYFIATDIDNGITEIWAKGINDGEWTRKNRLNKAYTPLVAVNDSVSGVTVPAYILLRDVTTNDVYHYVTRAIEIGDGKINGIVIDNQNKILPDIEYKLNASNQYDTIPVSVVCSNDPDNSSLSYCSIYVNDKIKAVNGVFNINNSILKSDDDGIYYKNFLAPTFSGTCNNNLIVVDKNGWKWENAASDTITTTSITFKNNTIISSNGIVVTSIDSSDTIKNNIIDAAAIAIGESGYNPSFTITNSIINGSIDDDVTVGSTNEIAFNPLFKSITNEDYTLQSKAEGYPKDSVAIGLGDDSKDAGCYDVTRTNTGESADSLTLQYIDTSDTTPPYQLPYRYEYPFKESSVTYQGNYIKNMDVRVGIITLDSQIGMDLEIQRELEYIQSLNVPIRFYPNGDTGIAFIIDKSGTTPDYSRDKSATLTLDFTAMTATAPTDFEFEINYLKGFWLEVDDGLGGDTYYYIDSNTKTVLSLINRENETTPGDGSYTCKILWCYARMQDVIEYPSALSDDAAEQQIISTSKIELFMLDRKDI